MKDILLFIRHNNRALIGVAIGVVLGYLHWYYFACYWGTYPLSAECWINCAYGGVSGGFIMCLLNETKHIR